MAQDVIQVLGPDGKLYNARVVIVDPVDPAAPINSKEFSLVTIEQPRLLRSKNVITLVANQAAAISSSANTFQVHSAAIHFDRDGAYTVSIFVEDDDDPANYSFLLWTGTVKRNLFHDTPVKIGPAAKMVIRVTDPVGGAKVYWRLAEETIV